MKIIVDFCFSFLTSNCAHTKIIILMPNNIKTVHYFILFLKWEIVSDQQEKVIYDREKKSSW